MKWIVVYALIAIGVPSNGWSAPPSTMAQLEDEFVAETARCQSVVSEGALTQCRDSIASLLDSYQRLSTGSRRDVLFGALIYCRLGSIAYERSLVVKDAAAARNEALSSYRACVAVYDGQSQFEALNSSQAENRDAANAWIKKLAFAELELTRVPLDARIFIDGELQPRIEKSEQWGVGDLNPGSHAIRVELVGHEPFESVVELSGGTLTSVAVVLKRVPTPPMHTPDPTHWSTYAMWSAAGLAAAGVVVAVTCQVVADSNEATIDAARDASGYVDPHRLAPTRALRLRDTAEDLRVARTMGWVAAGLGGGAALVFALWPTTAPQVALVPFQGGGSVLWQGRF